MVVDIAGNIIDDTNIELIYDRESEKYINCCCGAIINKKNKKRHEQSKRHTNYLDKLASKILKDQQDLSVISDNVI